jgi:hypothetical protein
MYICRFGICFSLVLFTLILIFTVLIDLLGMFLIRGTIELELFIFTSLVLLFCIIIVELIKVPIKYYIQIRVLRDLHSFYQISFTEKGHYINRTDSLFAIQQVKFFIENREFIMDIEIESINPSASLVFYSGDNKVLLFGQLLIDYKSDIKKGPNSVICNLINQHIK